MTYNHFFNLHIPKTGGTYFRENILYELKKAMEEKNISVSQDYVILSDGSHKPATIHWCWYKPYIHEHSYIFTTLRDPVKRLVSQYVWQAVRAIYLNNSDYTIDDITVTNFYKWLENSPIIYKNFQSKNLVYYNKDHSVYLKASPTIWKLNDVPKVNHFLFSKDFENYKIDKNELIDNINRINFITKSEDMRSLDNQLKIKNKIIDDLNLNVYSLSIKIDGNGNKNELSDKLYEQLTKLEIQKLYEFNDIDSEIYFSNIYTKY